MPLRSPLPSQSPDHKRQCRRVRVAVSPLVSSRGVDHDAAVLVPPISLGAPALTAGLCEPARRARVREAAWALAEDPGTPPPSARSPCAPGYAAADVPDVSDTGPAAGRRTIFARPRRVAPGTPPASPRSSPPQSPQSPVSESLSLSPLRQPRVVEVRPAGSPPSSTAQLLRQARSKLLVELE